MKRLLAVLAAGSLLLAGCGSSDPDDPASSSAPAPAGSTGGSSSSSAASGSITVFAAASLTEAFGKIEKAYEAQNPDAKITIEYGASSDFSTQIQQGKPADVFASASTKNMTAVKSQTGTPTDFVSNTLEIAVPPSNPGKITQLSDLAKSGVKVGVCDPAVPCGVVASEVFKNAKITVKPSASLKDVKSTLAVVESGEVDAGLVYVTDVRAAGSKVKGIEIPTDVNASTTYPIATLKDSKNAALAQSFVDYVLSPAGQQVLTAAGFSKP